MAPVYLTRRLSLSFICFILLFLVDFVQHVSPTLSYARQTLLEIGLFTQLLALFENDNQGSLPPYLEVTPQHWRSLLLPLD